jgi:hypothetical protein
MIAEIAYELDVELRARRAGADRTVQNQSNHAQRTRSVELRDAATSRGRLQQKTRHPGVRAR